MAAPKRKFALDQLIANYQSLSEKEKATVDVFIKALLVLLAILFIYKAGIAIGEFLFNVGVEV